MPTFRFSDLLEEPEVEEFRFSDLLSEPVGSISATSAPSDSIPVRFSDLIAESEPETFEMLPAHGPTQMGTPSGGADVERMAALFDAQEPTTADKVQEWLAPVDPARAGGVTAVTRNLGVDKVVGGVLGAFAQAGKSVIDLAMQATPGKPVNPAVLAEKSKVALETAAGFAAFPAQQLTAASVVAGLGPDGWNPYVEIIQRKLSGNPMKIEELEQKYPTFAKYAQELTFSRHIFTCSQRCY